MNEITKIDIAKVTNPWIIVYQPKGKGGEIYTILAGPDNADYEQFSLIITDVIRHVAKHFEVDESDVLRWIHMELDNPTTELLGGRLQ